MITDGISPSIIADDSVLHLVCGMLDHQDLALRLSIPSLLSDTLHLSKEALSSSPRPSLLVLDFTLRAKERYGYRYVAGEQSVVKGCLFDCDRVCYRDNV